MLLISDYSPISCVCACFQVQAIIIHSCFPPSPPHLDRKSDKKKKKKKKGKEEDPEEDQPKSVPPPRPPPPSMTPGSSIKQQIDGTCIGTASNGATNSAVEGITDVNDTDSNPSSTDLTTQDGSTSNPSASDSSPGSKTKSLEVVDLSSFGQVTASEGDHLPSGEPLELHNLETGGEEEVDGSKDGKEKEGAKVRPWLPVTFFVEGPQF